MKEKEGLIQIRFNLEGKADKLRKEFGEIIDRLRATEGFKVVAQGYRTSPLKDDQTKTSLIEP